MPPLLTLIVLRLILFNVAAGDTLTEPRVCWLTIDPRRGPPDPVPDAQYSSFVQNSSFDFAGLTRTNAFVVEDLLSPDKIAHTLRSAQATLLSTPRIWIPQDSTGPGNTAALSLMSRPLPRRGLVDDRKIGAF
ncbi:hypothetical protein HDU86_007622 [Geranomyces michiganensis]|nr:hypothetical protein HDU86_007622 [Geranomyces michiganensis]